MPDLLHFSDAGDAAGTPLVLIHPLGADRRFFDGVAAHLGPHVRTIAPDLRGSGNSPAATGPLTLLQSADDIEALRRHLGLPRLVVAGCAVGSMVAAIYATRYPDHTAALIMSNPGIRLPPAANENLTLRAAQVRAHGMAALLPQAIDNAFVGCEDSELRHSYEARFVAQNAESYALAALGVVGADLASHLVGMVCPTLLIVGGRDPLMAPENATEIAALVPGAETVEFTDAAHFIPYQQPQRFAETVAGFLDRHGLRGIAAGRQ